MLKFIQNQNLRQASFVRVDVEGLRNLNYLAGELLINQKKRNIQDEQIQAVTEQLLQQINRHQIILNQFHLLLNLNQIKHYFGNFQ